MIGLEPENPDDYKTGRMARLLKPPSLFEIGLPTGKKLPKIFQVEPAKANSNQDPAQGFTVRSPSSVASRRY
jgi:hypothetical protein